LKGDLNTFLRLLLPLFPPLYFPSELGTTKKVTGIDPKCPSGFKKK
jgi:hypothetical protein